MRERAKRFEMEWGAKHMATVEGPRTSYGERQQEILVSDVEQDTCTSADQPPGDVSLTDWAMETVDAEIVPWEEKSQVGEMTLRAGDHELNVYVESTKGEAAAQEREVKPPSKRHKQESDFEPRNRVHFSLCDDSSDQGAKSVGESAELDVCKKVRRRTCRRTQHEALRRAGNERHVERASPSLVRRARCAETKVKIATSKLARMEKERDQESGRGDIGGGSDKPVEGRERDRRQMVCR